MMCKQHLHVSKTKHFTTFCRQWIETPSSQINDDGEMLPLVLETIGIRNWMCLLEASNLDKR